MDELLLEQGLNLMLYGMGAVFGFLSLLVVAAVLMSTLVQRFFPEPQAPARADAGGGHTTSADVEPRVLAVIKAALEQHRK